MATLHSDAFVFFGATGDLAYKQIFPALQTMTRHGHLDMPVIGVAERAWTSDQLRARARKVSQEHGGVDPDAFAKLSARLQYISGITAKRRPMNACAKRLAAQPASALPRHPAQRV